MPGENYAIYGCTHSRRHKGFRFFNVPNANNDFNKKWASELINIITEDRVIGKPLKDRIERHKLSDQICVYPDSKVLIDGALPSLNLTPK